MLVHKNQGKLSKEDSKKINFIPHNRTLSPTHPYTDRKRSEMILLGIKRGIRERKNRISLLFEIRIELY